MDSERGTSRAAVSSSNRSHLSRSIYVVTEDRGGGGNIIEEESSSNNNDNNNRGEELVTVRTDSDMQTQNDHQYLQT